MYTVLLAFQQDHRLWIFAVFIELIVGGMIARVIIKKTRSLKRISLYWGELIILLIGLSLTYFDQSYLIGTGIATICSSLLNQWAKSQAPDRYINSDIKLSVLGSLTNQIILFGTLEIISLLKLDSKSALLLPYISHKQALQDTSEMLYLRVVMILIFILSGIFVIWFDRKNLEAIKKGCNLHP